MKQTRNPHRVIISLIIMAGLLLNACQFNQPTGQPQVTPVRTRITPKITPSPTPGVVSSATPTFPADVMRLNGMKLLVWHPWMDEIETALETEVEEFNQTNAWGLTVELAGFGGAAILEDAFLQADQDERPALLLTSPESLSDLQKQTDALLNLDILAEDSEWGLTSAEKEDFLPGVWQTTMEDRQRLGMPIFQNARFLVYNRTWSGELGFTDSPATPQDFQEQVCAAVKANLAAGYAFWGSGGWLLDTDAHTLLGWLQGFGADFSQDYTFNTPQGLAAFSYLHQLVDEDCAYRLAIGFQEPYEPFASRKTLAYSASLVDLPMQAQVNKKLVKTDTWQIIPFPSTDGRGILPIFSLDAAIRDSSHEQELGAWLFLRWLLLSRNQAGLARTAGMIPVTRSGLVLLNASGLAVPQFREVLGLLEKSQPVRGGGEWDMARRVLEEAAWQLYQPYTKPENIPLILEQLDAMILELSAP